MLKYGFPAVSNSGTALCHDAETYVLKGSDAGDMLQTFNVGHNATKLIIIKLHEPESNGDR